MKIFNKLQDEMVDWQKHNFPNRPDWLPLIGAVEELGELAESEDNLAECLDAVGDVAIYLADYCNAMGYSLDRIWENEIATKTYGISLDHVKALQIHLGRLAHAHIKAFQNIRMNENHKDRAQEAIGRILMHLDGICTVYLTTLEGVVENTWTVVRARDWQKNRNMAHQAV